MKILQLNFEKGWRGGERQTLLCMRQFRQAGHQVELVARGGEALARAAQAEGFTVHGATGMAGLCGYLLRRGRRFDVLHAQTANTLTWLAVLKNIVRRPIVFTRRTAFNVPEKRLPRTLWKWRRVDRFVAISQAAAAEPRKAGLPVTIIPSAIEPQPMDLPRTRSFSLALGLGDRKVLATAAALTREKDPCTLVRAVHCLSQQRNDFVFIHLGADGDAQVQAHALVRELGLEGVYRFAGFQEKVEDLYRLMDVFVSSSRSEALGTSVLDAFLYSVPVVSTNAGGLAELLADGRGIACEVGDAQGLAAGIARVLDDAALRGDMVRKAYAYVAAEHDPAVMGSRYLAEYDGLIEAKRKTKCGVL